MYYTHLEPNIKTIRQIFDRPLVNRASIFKNVKKEDFLDLKVVDGEKSYKIRDKIFEYYDGNQSELVNHSAENITLDSPINISTTFWIEDTYVVKDFLFTQTKNIVPTDNTNTFIAEHLALLFSNKGYVKQSTFASYKKLHAEMQVFMWVRSLGRGKKSQEKQINISDKESIYNSEKGGQWINVTSFVKNLDTNVTKTGGNFSIDLAPIMCKYDESEDSWSIDGVIGNATSTQVPYYAKTSTHNVKNGSLSKNELFFHQIISENDLVYIRWESLKMEENSKRNLDDIKINACDVVVTDYNADYTPKRIGKNVYDMIGLVDKNRTSTNYSNNQVSINISGRDLVKLFIEDGTHFFPMEFASGKFFTAGGVASENKLLQRNLFDANIMSLSVYQEKDIQYIFQFLISQLSNTGYIPDYVFEGYEGRRNTTINALKLTKSKEQIKAESEYQNIYNDIEKALQANDTDIQNANKKDGFVATTGLDNGTQNQRVSKGMSKLIDFVQYMNDTYAWFKDSNTINSYKYNGVKYNKKNQYPIELLGTLLPRTKTKTVKTTTTPAKKTNSGNPFTLYSAVEDYIAFTQTITTEEKTLTPVYNSSDKDTSKMWQISSKHPNLLKALNLAKKYVNTEKPKDTTTKTNKDFLKGLWQIIDIVIDENVRNRVLVDTSIAGHTGNIFSALQRVCIEPFAEMLFDTYGDRYCVLVRQQPFDYNGVTNCLTGQNLTYSQYDENGKIKKKTNENGVNITDDSKFNLVIDLDENLIQNENIEWYSGDVFSWYRINPQGYLFGSSNALTWLYLPAVYFSEYAEIWGSRPWVLNSPYIVDKSFVLDSNSGFKQDPLLVQSYYDLKYMIDSHCYLPFTKTGSFTIAGGDRRIKRGTWVRRKATGEVFYVESVSNSGDFGSSVNRRTVIQVSHGMVEKYTQLQSVVGYDNDISYFNIIDTKLNFDKVKNEQTDKNKDNPSEEINTNLQAENVLKTFKVNRDVFDFFVSKNQYKDVEKKYYA